MVVSRLARIMDRGRDWLAPPGETPDRFRRTIDQAPVGISHHGPDGRWLMANRRFCELLGYSCAELFELTIAQITHPDDIAVTLAQIQRVLNGEIGEYDQEKRYRRKDGSYLWVSVHVSLVRDATQNPDYIIAVVQDISARKLVEQSLIASERRFRLLFERSLDAMAVTDDEGRYLHVNAAAAELLGYSQSDLLTMRVTDLHSTGTRSTRSQFQAYLADPEQRGTFRFRRPDGEERIARHASAEIAPGEHLAILHDITDRVRQAAALRESEQTLRTVLDSLPVGVWFTNPEGEIVYGNPAGQRVWDGPALVGVDGHVRYNGWWAETGRPIAADEWAITRALQGESVLNEAIDIETADGERKRIINSALPLHDGDGRIRGVVLVVDDVTTHHRAEAERAASQGRLAAVVNTAADAIVNVDRQGRIETFNPAAERMFGYPQNDIIGKRVDNLMTLPQVEEHHHALAADLERLAQRHAALETTARRSNGSLFPAELSVSAMEQLGSYTCIIRDVTERKAAQATLRETERMAAVGSLAAGLAHDMANLVAPIRMGTSLLERLHLDEQARAAVAIISRCAASLVDLTDGVRLLIRGDPAAAPHAVDLSAWWSQARPLLQAALPPGVALGGEFPELIAPVEANEGQLTRAILNLVTNAGEAIAAAGDRGGHVVVWARPAENEDKVLIGVRDDGPGIPPHAVERLFEPFFSTKPWSRSSGLGLASVKAFATDSGGSVAIDTAVGQGTDIVLQLRTCSQPSN
jgi:PAS domain S-box-containing protein